MTPPPANPIARFAVLLDEARHLDPRCVPEPTAFALATVDAAGMPSVRIVLLKAVDERGFVFYTNHESRKGRELLATRRAALCFHWQPMETQVRVEGSVDVVTDAEADAYFASRARGSQVGAWASQQSRPLPRFADLEQRVASYETEFAGGAVPRPGYWSGFRVEPNVIEFWKAQPSRLHTREVYRQTPHGWQMEMLYP